MFLYQKFDYVVRSLKTRDDLKKMVEIFDDHMPKICAFDTETTGLNHITDIPFLFIFGFDKSIYLVDMLDNPILDETMKTIYNLMATCQRSFAHNAKYDYHMLRNGGYPIPKNVALADSQTVARLTNYADEVLNKDLATMGQMYVSEDAKFAGKVIKENLNRIRAERTKVAKEYLKEHHKGQVTEIWDAFKSRVQYLETPYDAILDVLTGIYKEPNYLDVYREKPALMRSYASDDVVIILEWMKKALPVLKEVDPKLETFNRECDLISVVADYERVGFLMDVDYLLKSRERVLAYREKLYNELHELAGVPFTVYQGDFIKKLFAQKFRIRLDKTDGKALNSVNGHEDAMKIASLIRRLRTVDKWLSTYIDGVLNKIVDGRLHTSIDNSGAVSGRVSCDLQQQPKFAMSDDNDHPIMWEDGEYLFNPRRAFLVDEGYKLYFYDYNQQELRVQAYETLVVSGGDEKLCRAYMPFNCHSLYTGEPFDYKIPEVLAQWNSGEWVLNEDPNKFWEPTDVHAETTFKAFDFLNNDVNHPEFKHYRKLGKVCNFLKNYQGGVGAIIDQLNVSEEIAIKLDRAYYEAFPKIKDYQRDIVNSFTKYGYIKNLYGRRYYMQNAKFYYKGGNYLVQGSCADMVKLKQLQIAELLSTTTKYSSIVLPIHDEIVFRIADEEQWVVPIIKAIMEDVPEVPWIPMVCEVEVSSTNWADKKGWDEL
jgi:DNA polymerase I